MPAYYFLFSILRLSFVIARSHLAEYRAQGRCNARGHAIMPEGILENVTNQCAHKICSCPARADTGYCGGYCMTASQNPDADVVCGCGHPECKSGDIPMPTQSS
jgi:hypothetical protein